MIAHVVSLLDIVDPDVAVSFHCAARNGDINAVVDMLRAGMPVNCFDDNDRTALHWAALNNRVDVVHVLLESGVNINWQNLWGNTPLMEAVKRNNTVVMEMLLQYGADQSIVDEEGITALEIARILNYEEAIRLLEKY